MKRILLTGSTGFIGKELLKELLKKNYNVRCLVRKPQYTKYKRIEEWVGDLKKPETLRDIAKDIDLVFHLAAKNQAPLLKKEDTEEYFKVNYEGTRNLLKEVIKYKVERFVYLSSFSAFGTIFNRSEPEKNKTEKPITPYGKSKLKAEKYCIKLCNQHKISLLVIRPPAVYDLEELTFDFKTLDGFIKLRFVPIIGKGDNVVNLVSRKNLIKNILLLSDSKKEGKHLVYDRPLTLNEIIDMLMKKNKLTWVYRITIPLTILRIGALFLFPIFNFFGISFPLSYERLNQIQNSK